MNNFFCPVSKFYLFLEIFKIIEIQIYILRIPGNHILYIHETAQSVPSESCPLIYFASRHASISCSHYAYSTWYSNNSGGAIANGAIAIHEMYPLWWKRTRRSRKPMECESTSNFANHRTSSPACTTYSGMYSEMNAKYSERCLCWLSSRAYRPIDR